MTATLFLLALAVSSPARTAAAGPAASAYLPVPLIRQERDLCGAASLAMVFQFWGRNISQYAIAAAVGKGSGRGIRGEDLRDFCVQSGFSAFVFRGDLTGVRGHLQKGRPVIVAVRSRSARRFHYIVLVGFDDAASVVLANDPQRGALVRIPVKRYLAQWERSRQWSLLVVPK